jgi:hypothetical protein
MNEINNKPRSLTPGERGKAMNTFHTPNDFNHGRHKSEPTDRVCHTYQQIARIIAKRNGESITPANVQQICRMAEAKLARALLTDAFPPSRPPNDATTYRAMHFGDVDDESPNLRKNL